VTRLFDYTIIGLYLGGVIWLGVRLARGQNTGTAYLLGDRNLPWWAVLGSIIATETSSVTFLSIPGLSFASGQNASGLLFLQLTLGYILGRLVVVVLLLPRYFSGELFTAYEVLEKRFGGLTKLLASGLFLLMRNLADGLRLYLTALVVYNLLGWNIFWAILLLAGVTTLYTFYGGLRSVVWNDCLQLLMYLLGALVAIAVICWQLGQATVRTEWPLLDGLRQIVIFGWETGRLRIFDFELTLVRPYTFWAGVLGGVFVALATHGTDQLMVQRYLSARGYREAARALAWSGPLVAAQFALFLFLGIGLAAYYALVEKGIQFPSVDAALPHFVVHSLPPGISGLVIAAVLAAAMSTLSSSLNASASALISDFGCRLRPQLREDPISLFRSSRLATLAFAAIQVAVAASGPFWSRTVVENVMAIATVTSGLTLGIFLLAVLWPKAEQSDALMGFIAGCIVDGYIVFGTRVGWPWYAVFGATTVLVVGIASQVIKGALHRGHPPTPSG
jgi:SSS family transporter